MNQDPEFQGIRVWGPGQEDLCRVWGKELEDCKWGEGDLKEMQTMAPMPMNQVSYILIIIFFTMYKPSLQNVITLFTKCYNHLYNMW